MHNFRDAKPETGIVRPIHRLKKLGPVLSCFLAHRHMILLRSSIPSFFFLSVPHSTALIPMFGQNRSERRKAPRFLPNITESAFYRA